MVHNPSNSRDRVVFASIFRLFGAVVCLVLAGITGFGFLASFEEPGATVWKLGFGTASVLFFGVFSLMLAGAIRGFQGVSR